MGTIVLLDLVGGVALGPAQVLSSDITLAWLDNFRFGVNRVDLAMSELLPLFP